MREAREMKQIIFAGGMKATLSHRSKNMTYRYHDKLMMH